MEPANLNPSPGPDDEARLEAMLRGALPTLRDDGFASRVLTALPPEKPAPRTAHRVIFCLAGAAIGCALALWRLPAWSEVESNLGSVGSALGAVSQAFANPALPAAIVVAVVSLVYVFRTELGERLTR